LADKRRNDFVAVLRAGCPVKVLWQRLEALLPLDGVAALNDGIKQYLWDALMQQQQDVQLCAPPVEAATT
jgi:hypothetical protein